MMAVIDEAWLVGGAERDRAPIDDGVEGISWSFCLSEGEFGGRCVERLGAG